MAQARRKPTTKTASKPAPARDFIDPATLPDIYCSTNDGVCLSPLIPDGATIAFSKLEEVKAGDFVSVWHRPEITNGKHQAIVKRLVMNIAPWVKFPYKDHPKSDVLAIIMAEQINPKRTFTIKCSDVLAVHKAIGFMPKRNKQGGMINLADLLPMPK